MKIDVSEIIGDHIRTIKNDNTGKPGGSDIFLFIMLPVLVSGVLIYFELLIKESLIESLIAALAIFVGLLFNVIVIIIDSIRKTDQNDVKSLLLKEVLANISFTIFLSILAIVTVLATLFSNELLKNIANAITYFLLVEFLVTLLMVLKRIYSLFKHEMNNSDS
jgi:glucan phosphoethanolaminetransferase (alkaline phosphatase superfamily)